MKYPITLLVLAAAMLLVGVGIHMHAEWRYTNKLYYHTIDSTLYEFEDVFAERKLADTIQLLSIIGGMAGGCWVGAVMLSRNRRKRL